MRLRVLSAIALAFVLAACSQATDAGPSNGTEPRVVEVRMSDELRFDPSTISVIAGETVRFKIVNDGQAVHEFLIGDAEQQAEYAAEMAEGEMHHASEAGVSVDPGATEEFEFRFDEPGELLAGCHEPGHYDAGMVATITIAAR